MADKYTGKERVQAALKGERLDRVPISFHIPKAHEYAGYAGKEMMDPDKALDAQIKAHEVLPSDIVNVPGDPYLPTTIQARAKEKAGTDDIPHPPAMLADKSAIGDVPIRDPKQSRRYTKYLEMCQKTQEAFPGCWVQALSGAPWSIAAGLRGIEALIFDTRQDPQFVHDLMEIAVKISKARCDALLETGVALMLGEPSASCSVISPKIYKEFIHPYLKDLIAHFKSQEGTVDLHICGYNDPNMEDLLTLDMDIIDADGPTSLENTVELSPGKAAIRGNLPADLFHKGTPGEIDEAVKTCIEVAGPSNQYILAQGCSIPYETPDENLQAFFDAGIKYGTYQ